ncbi:MAG: RagB/SusD family nutrient uptake outer membrane protein [Desulfobacterales bacterium]|nr:RagB/SusD family nutrient uptake outer membrane protein [Desulfobacterales bacterium]
MKTNIKLSLCIWGSAFLLFSCEDYLDIPPYADITEEDVFKTFEDYLGFVDVCFTCFHDYNDIGQNGGTQYGDEAYHRSNSNSYWSMTGDYLDFYSTPVSVNKPKNKNKTLGLDNDRSGIYTSSYIGIRIANTAILNIDELQATKRQKELILGEAYFFKAFFHWQLVKFYGGMPYISRPIPPDETTILPRLSVMETVDSIAADLTRADALLPVDWNEVLSEMPRSSTNSELGRPTKGAAKAIKAQALLFAGSPLCNFYSSGYKHSTGTYEYSDYYMELAARSAYEVIQLANSGVYGLVGLNEFYSIFSQEQDISTWISPSGVQETIWAKVNSNTSSNNIKKTWSGAPLNRIGRNIFATQNMVNQFFTADGYEIEHSASNYDLQNPWQNRDPRLRETFVMDGDEIYADNIWQSDRANSQPTSYLARKYLPLFVATINFSMQSTCPHARLGEMYLIYAEAVNELLKSPIQAPSFAVGYSAADAVNDLRSRPTSLGSVVDMTPIMPNVLSDYLTHMAFRQHVRKERASELAYEAHRWFDIRRWHVAHRPEHKVLFNLEFDSDAGDTVFTNFQEVEIFTRIFDEKHYWVPFPNDQVKFSEDFQQNPGW